ncbi:eCIS core domain-containing protein [Streptomyces misionensis]|uniref:eCIS core domain-containing protein n=1 Tax=Streptomyces misionensis TaxID=67331 RepID=UPI0036C016C6
MVRSDVRGHRKRHEETAGAEPATARTADARRPGPGAPVRPDALPALQRLIGNAAVGELLNRAGPEHAGPEHADPEERRSASVRRVLRSPGRPLDEPVRADMETRLGADFSDVRVHTDRAAHESAAAVAAEAYTSGSHIVFRRGRYDTASDAGREVLAHELTHVVQQRRGPVAGSDTGAGLALSDPSDRFEREAERVAAGALPGAAAAPPAGRPGAGLPVARLISVEEFRRRTAVGRFEKRGSSIEAVERELAAYHKLPQEGFSARFRQLEKIRAAAEEYARNSKSKRHQAEVDSLVAESHTESNDIRLDAVIEEIIEQVRAHQEICRRLEEARNTADGLARARLLLAAQDTVLTRIEETGAAVDSDLSLTNARLADWVNGVVRDLPEDDRRRLVEDDLDRLDAIRRDPGAPQVTRDLLGDLLAHRGIVGFTTGMPGTSLSPEGSAEKYSMRHAVYQGQGTTERLGSLAHELTHVDAGESYANTAILLLLRRGLGDDEIRRLAEERNAEIDLLKNLLEQDGGTLTAAQSDLFRAKLDYASDPQKGVGRYAASFKSHGKIDEPTYQYLMRVELLTAKKSSVLVEYDTVITQLLVYLHRWGVAHDHPLYAEVARLAARLRSDRADAATADR